MPITDFKCRGDDSSSSGQSKDLQQSIDQKELIQGNYSQSGQKKRDPALHQHFEAKTDKRKLTVAERKAAKLQGYWQLNVNQNSAGASIKTHRQLSSPEEPRESMQTPMHDQGTSGCKRVRSSSPRHYWQPVNAAQKRRTQQNFPPETALTVQARKLGTVRGANVPTRATNDALQKQSAEQSVASPRFSQNQTSNHGAKLIQRTRSPLQGNQSQFNEPSLEDQLSYEEEYDEEQAVSQNGRSSQLRTTNRQSMKQSNFNTQDLVDLTCQDNFGGSIQVEEEAPYLVDHFPQQIQWISQTQNTQQTAQGGNRRPQPTHTYGSTKLGLTDDVGFASQIYGLEENPQFQTNNDDTFRGENFIQRTMREGFQPSTTQEKQFSYPRNTNFALTSTIQVNTTTPSNAGNLTLSELNYSHGLNGYNQLAQTAGGALSIPAGTGTMDSRFTATGLGDDEKNFTTLANTKRVPGFTYNNTYSKLQKREEVGQKLQEYRFTQLIEKYWLKQKVSSIHQELFQHQQSIVGQKGAQRIDSYFKHFNYQRQSWLDILNDVEHLVKKIVSQETPHNQSQQIGRGLSRLSELESNFQNPKTDGGQTTNFNNFTRMQYADQQSMNSYHNALVNSNVNARPKQATPQNSLPQNVKALNAQLSSSTFQSKLDVENEIVELQQLKKYKDESEAIVNNLRRTIKDMTKQMNQMEIKIQIFESDGLQREHPTHDRVDLQKIELSQQHLQYLQEKGAQSLRFDIEQKQLEINELKFEQEAVTRSLKEKFRSKFDEQSQFIEELKSELSAAAKRSQDMQTTSIQNSAQLKQLRDSLDRKAEENLRLESQIDSLTKQNQNLKSKLLNNDKEQESDKMRLQSSKEQEKHWKCGYESIFSKYSKLKEQMANQEQEMRRKEWDYEHQLKNLTAKAEEAIRYFKDIALSRSGTADILKGDSSQQINQQVESRHSRFEPAQSKQNTHQQASSQLWMANECKFRSKSANSPFLQDQTGIRDNAQTAQTRVGYVTGTPTREHCTSQSVRTFDQERLNSIEARQRAQNLRQSSTPDICGPSALRQPISITIRRETLQNDREAGTISPSNFKRLVYVDRIHSQILRENDDRTDQKFFLVLEALEKAYAEINQFKRESCDLAIKHYARNCNQMQDFQVLSYDYLEKIDEYIGRELKLKQQVAEKQAQIAAMGGIINQAKRMIQALLEHVQDQKSFKEMQWKNIISYDLVKEQEKRKLQDTVKKEVARAKRVVTDLHEKAVQRENLLELKNNDIQAVEHQKCGIENSLSSLKKTLEQTQSQLQRVTSERNGMEARMNHIQLEIRELNFGTCGSAVLFQPHLVQQNAFKKLNLPSASNSCKPGGFANLNSLKNSSYISNVNLDDRDKFAAEGEVHQSTPHLASCGNLPAQEVVLGYSRGGIRTNAESNQMTPQKPEKHESQPNFLLINPIMPLEWLSQIKHYIQELQSRTDEDREYIASLRGILETGNYPTEPEMMQFEDAYSLSGMSNEEFPAQGRDAVDCFSRNTTNQNTLNPKSQRFLSHVQSFQNTNQQTLSHYNQYAPSGNPTSGNTPARDAGQKPLKHEATLSQSLESFINNKADREQPQKSSKMQQSKDTTEYANNQSLPQRLNFGTFNNIKIQNQGAPQGQDEDQADGNAADSENNYQLHDEGELATFRQRLPLQLQQLLQSNQIKSRTILSMQAEIESRKESFQQVMEDRNQVTDELQMKIDALISKKDQLTHMYQQENQMRQELEVQVEEKTCTIHEANLQIQSLEKEFEQMQDQVDSLMVQKQKLEQSSEYWQGSFKLIEQHFIEEKQRSDCQIQNLTNQNQIQEEEISEIQHNLDNVLSHVQRLEEEWLPVKKAREDVKVISVQTEETCSTIQQYLEHGRLLQMENGQVKRDIQVLINSYENFRQESQQIQESQREKLMKSDSLKDKERQEYEARNLLIIERLNDEVQDEIKLKQQKDGLISQHCQKIEELALKLKHFEKEKLEANSQIQNQKDQLDQLNQFNRVIQNFNVQLQLQVEKLHLQQPNGSAARFERQSTKRSLPWNYLNSKTSLVKSQSIGQYAAINGQNPAISSSTELVDRFNQYIQSLEDPRNGHFTFLKGGNSSPDFDQFKPEPQRHHTIVVQTDKAFSPKAMNRKAFADQAEDTLGLKSRVKPTSSEAGFAKDKQDGLLNTHQDRKGSKKTNHPVIAGRALGNSGVKSYDPIICSHCGGRNTLLVPVPQDNQLTLPLQLHHSRLRREEQTEPRTCFVSVGCQTPQETLPHSQHTLGRAGAFPDPRSLILNAWAPTPSGASRGKGIPQQIFRDIEELGSSLDSKIGVFVQLLMSLKGAQKQIKKNDSVSKLLQPLQGTISKVIHELTIDTETLSEINTRLMELQSFRGECTQRANQYGEESKATSSAHPSVSEPECDDEEQRSSVSQASRGASRSNYTDLPFAPQWRQRTKDSQRPINVPVRSTRQSDEDMIDACSRSFDVEIAAPTVSKPWRAHAKQSTNQVYGPSSTITGTDSGLTSQKNLAGQNQSSGSLERRQNVPMSTRPRGNNQKNQCVNQVPKGERRGYQSTTVDQDKKTTECQKILQSYTGFSTQKQAFEEPCQYLHYRDEEEDKDEQETDADCVEEEESEEVREVYHAQQQSGRQHSTTQSEQETVGLAYSKRHKQRANLHVTRGVEPQVSHEQNHFSSKHTSNPKQGAASFVMPRQESLSPRAYLNQVATMRNPASKIDAVIRRNFQSNESSDRTHQTHESDQERCYEDPHKKVLAGSLGKPFQPNQEVLERIYEQQSNRYINTLRSGVGELRKEIRISSKSLKPKKSKRHNFDADKIGNEYKIDTQDDQKLKYYQAFRNNIQALDRTVNPSLVGHQTEDNFLKGSNKLAATQPYDHFIQQKKYMNPVITQTKDKFHQIPAQEHFQQTSQYSHTQKLVQLPPNYQRQVSPSDTNVNPGQNQGVSQNLMFSDVNPHILQEFQYGKLDPRSQKPVKISQKVPQGCRKEPVIQTMRPPNGKHQKQQDFVAWQEPQIEMHQRDQNNLGFAIKRDSPSRLRSIAGDLSQQSDSLLYYKQYHTMEQPNYVEAGSSYDEMHQYHSFNNNTFQNQRNIKYQKD